MKPITASSPSADDEDHGDQPDLGAGDDREAGQGAGAQRIGEDHRHRRARDDGEEDTGAKIGNKRGEREHVSLKEEQSRRNCHIQ